ncbi:hypothetical protein JCGZ_02541 [Jatropha curcas]|uniref:NAC transcription factor 076 n=1 Tax=Jatropha curcas TaxID=180498 RepID=R4N5S7_JATCU|nr:NAC transcription factor 076 [Jatropha curcas]KDP39521.1 hypothetical protein JCGZ_02541 [Jatropha curcas]
MASPTSESVQDVGDGFRPTEKELVNHYLKLKMLGCDHQVSRIPEIDIYKHEPWDLPNHLGVNSNGKESYFFHSCRSGRPRRTTKAGYWKGTGKKREIKNAEEEIVIKSIFVFYKGRTPKGIRAEWTMHVYSAAANQRDFVLCKLFRKAKIYKRAIDITAPTNNDEGTIRATDNGELESTIPASDEGELCQDMAPYDLQNQNSYQKTDYSTFYGAKTCKLMTCENQATDAEIIEQVDFHTPTNDDETADTGELDSTIPAPDKGELCQDMAPYDLENQNSCKKTDYPTFYHGETRKIMICENQAIDAAIAEQFDLEPLPNMDLSLEFNEQSCTFNSALDSYLDLSLEFNEQSCTFNSALDSYMDLSLEFNEFIYGLVLGI